MSLAQFAKPRLARPPLAFYHPVVLIATWFGAGLLRPAPGSWGSLAALPLAWLLSRAGGPFWLGSATVAVFILGCWAAGRYAAAEGRADPASVVIDEVAGQWLVLLFTPFSPFQYLLGFALFRLFDIAKPWPVSWADQQIKGGLGIMLDDVIAGLYGLAALSLAQYLQAL